MKGRYYIWVLVADAVLRFIVTLIVLPRYFNLLDLSHSDQVIVPVVRGILDVFTEVTFFHLIGKLSFRYIWRIMLDPLPYI